MKRKLLKIVMQLMANYIIYMLENAYSDEMLKHYYEIGVTLDAYAVEFYDIYLD